MRFKLLVVPAISALVLAFMVIPASGASAQVYATGYPTVPIVTAPVLGATVVINEGSTPNVQTGFAGAGVNVAPAADAAIPSGCSAYDSWCSYCADHSGAGACLAMPDPSTTTDIASLPQDVQPDSGTALLAPSTILAAQ